MIDAGPAIRADWARRCVRVALWLILFGLVGAVLLAGPLLAMRGGEEIGTDLPRGTDEEYPLIDGPTTVFSDAGVYLVAYYPTGHYPDGTCMVTAPDGTDIPETSELVKDVLIDGEEHTSKQVFVTSVRGEYTVKCTAKGYRVGPGRDFYDDVGGGVPAELWTALLASAPALLLPTAAVMPLLVIALVVRLISGRREVIPGRRAYELPLSLAIAAGLATCAGILVFALAVVARVLARWDARLPESPLMLVYVALPCILLAVVTLAAGMRAWQSRPAAAIVSSSGPHGAPESVGETPPSHPTEP